MINRIEEYSKQLRQLNSEYYYQKISLDEYRQRRKIILIQLDYEINHLTKNENIMLESHHT
ncbi:MAG: hypothetical protein HY080_02545 [Gammaproteobacteria bacterium]|nr:hypothetical protein [Gammaproteobacteria bacterium]